MLNFVIKQHTRIFTLLRAGRKRKHNFHQHFCPSYFFPPPPVYCNNAFGQVGVLPIPPDQILFTAFFPRLQMSNGDAFSEEPSGGVDRGTRERAPGKGHQSWQPCPPGQQHIPSWPLPFMELSAPSPP